MSKKEDKVEQFFNQWWIGDLPKEGFNKTAMLDFAQLYAQSQVEKATSELVEALNITLKAIDWARDAEYNESMDFERKADALWTKVRKAQDQARSALRNARPQQSFITGLEEHNPSEL